MEGDQVYYENIEEALRSAVNATGGPLVVGPRLWPDMDPLEARGKLLRCLEPQHKQRLAPSQVLMLLRWAQEAGYHGAKHWIDGNLGYTPTPPINPLDEQASATQALVDATKVLERALERVEKMQVRKPELHSVKAG